MNKILLELAIKDGLTPVLNAQIAQAKELQKAYSQAARLARADTFTKTGKWALPTTGTKGTQGIMGTVGSITALGGQVAAIAGTAMAVYGAASGFISSIAEGARMQNESLRVASDISTRLGVTFRESRAIVEQSQADIQKLASALPGSTKDYQQVFNGIAVAVAKNAQGDKARFNKEALDLTKRFGAMSAIVGADATDAGQAINRFLSGTATFGEISRIDAIQKNTGFVDTFRSTASSMGLNVERSKQWSFAQRMAVLQKAAEKAMPDELLDEFSNSVDGLYQTLKDSFVSPVSGMFGVLRKVSQRDDRTVMDAVKSLLSSTKRFFENMGSIAKALGLTDDPMAYAIDTIDTIASLMNRFSVGIEAIKDRFSRLSSFEAQLATADSLGYALGEWLGSLASKLFSPQAIQAALRGDGLTKATIVGLGSMVNGFFSGLAKGLVNSWSPVVTSFINDLKAAFSALGRELASRLPGLVGSMVPGSSVVTGLGSFISPLVPEPVKALGAKANEALKGATGIDLGIGLPETPKPQASSTITNQLSFVLPETTSDPQAIASVVIDRLNGLLGTARAEVLV